MGVLRTHFLFLFSVTLSTLAFAGQPSQPSHPESDPDFLRLPSGKKLTDVRVSGQPLSLARGTGGLFTSAQQNAFEALRRESKSNANHPVQWVLMNLDNRRVVDSSAAPDRKQFGASVSKIFVAGALLDKQSGNYRDNSQLQLLADMLVVSSNTAWIALQNQAGDGDADRGRETIHRFTQRMGYRNTRGFQGYWGKIHGNELTPTDLANYLYDTYQNQYPGSETVWRIMHTLRTGGARAYKYIPHTQFVGGKTGTYDGQTVDPETGLETRPDGRPYTVRVRHQVLVFNRGGVEYGLAILADTGNDEHAAVLAGGLYRELAGGN